MWNVLTTLTKDLRKFRSAAKALGFLITDVISKVATQAPAQCYFVKFRCFR